MSDVAEVKEALERSVLALEPKDLEALAAAARSFVRWHESFPADEDVAAVKAKLIRLGENVSMENIRVALGALKK